MRASTLARRGLAVTVVVLVLMTAASASCASLPPQKPVNSVSAIEGKWRGNIQFGGGPYQIFYLTIKRDGSLVASWGITTRWGNVSLSGGKARFSLYIWSGDLQYLEGDGQRIIILKEDFASFYAQVTPLK